MTAERNRRNKISKEPHTEGREIRWAEVDADDVGEHSNAFEDIYEDRLDALVLRNSFPSDVAAVVVGQFAQSSELPWLRPNRIGPNTDIRVLGVSATPTFETPGGPEVDGYFRDAEQYEQVTRELLGDFSAPAYIEGLLGTVSRGRPVGLLVDSKGRRFASCTVRSLPEGQSIIVHNDHFHFNLPVYADAVGQLDAAISLSFFALLQAPEGGGELIVHGLAHDDETPRTENGFPDGQAIATRYRFHKFRMNSSDAIVFGAGKFYHHVEPIMGATPRVTLGGFLALDKDHKSVVYWN